MADLTLKDKKLVENIFFFLLEFHSEIKKNNGKTSIGQTFKKADLFKYRQFLSRVLQSKGIVRKIGTGSGVTWKWLSVIEPTKQMAGSVLKEMRIILNTEMEVTIEVQPKIEIEKEKVETSIETVAIVESNQNFIRATTKIVSNLTIDIINLRDEVARLKATKFSHKQKELFCKENSKKKISSMKSFNILWGAFKLEFN